MKALLIIGAIFITLANVGAEFQENGRVIGGEEVSITDLPWQVSLVGSYGHFCAGSIINRRTILTAAHCLFRTGYEGYERSIRVRVGSTNRNRGGILMRVKKALRAPNYGNPSPYENDIGILILWIPLFYNKYVQPIALPKQNEDIAVDETVVVSGWGINSTEYLTNAENLHAASVQIIDRDVCREAYVAYEEVQIYITNNMICAGILDVGGVDFCSGDSGGPLALLSGERPVLYGIVSWGVGCSDPTYPGVYTRVSSYVDWIKMHYK